MEGYFSGSRYSNPELGLSVKKLTLTMRVSLVLVRANARMRGGYCVGLTIPAKLAGAIAVLGQRARPSGGGQKGPPSVEKSLGFLDLRRMTTVLEYNQSGARNGLLVQLPPN